MGVGVSVNATLPPPLCLCIKAFQENGWSVKHVFYKNFLDVKMGFTVTVDCSESRRYGEGHFLSIKIACKKHRLMTR